MSALSINKQVFIKLHPDLENEVLKFYQTKRLQRDEAYNRLSQEILSQGLSKSNTFYKKHGNLAQMINKKALNTFTDRENRTSVAQKNSSALIKIETNSPTNYSDSTGTPLGTYSMNRSSINFQSGVVNMHRAKASRWNTDEASLSELPEVETRTRADWKSPSGKLNEQNSPVLKKPLNRASSPVQEHYIKLEKLNASVQSHSLHWEHQCVLEHDISEKPSTKAHGHEGARKAHGSIMKGGAISDLGGGHEKSQEFSRDEILISEELTDTKRLTNSVSRELISLLRPQISHLRDVRKAISPKARTIRMKTESSQPEDVFISNGRTLMKDQLRNSYYEKIKLPEGPDATDLENFRFDFSDNQNGRRKRTQLTKTNSEREKALQPKVVPRKIKVMSKDSPTEESPSLSPSKKIAPSQTPLQHQDLSGTRSPSPKFKFVPQTFESVRKGPNYSQANFRKRLDTSSGNHINLSLSNSIKYHPDKTQVVTPTNSTSIIGRFSTTVVLQNSPDIASPTEFKEESTAKRRLREINLMAGSPSTATSRQSNSNPLIQILMRKSYTHNKLHQKPATKPVNSTDIKELSKNNSNYSLRIDNR